MKHVYPVSFEVVQFCKMPAENVNAINTEKFVILSLEKNVIARIIQKAIILVRKQVKVLHSPSVGHRSVQNVEKVSMGIQLMDINVISKSLWSPKCALTQNQLVSL